MEAEFWAQKLIEAVWEKVAEQASFVAWWDNEGPGANHGGDRRSKITVGLSWTVARAEEEFGIGVMTVSRWRTSTAPDKVDAYRQQIILGAYRPAGWSPLSEGARSALMRREFARLVLMAQPDQGFCGLHVSVIRTAQKFAQESPPGALTKWLWSMRSRRITARLHGSG